jgi:nucleoid-associated protein YgaU
MGTTGYKQWTVRDGDTIDWIAYSEYGDSKMWRYIADVNGLDDPSRLRTGQKLSIAPLP